MEHSELFINIVCSLPCQQNVFSSADNTYDQQHWPGSLAFNIMGVAGSLVEKTVLTYLKWLYAIDLVI